MSLLMFNRAAQPQNNHLNLIKHDGEGDDLQGQAIINGSLKGKNVTVFTDIGNPDYVYASENDKYAEMTERMNFSRMLFDNATVHPGSYNNGDVCEPFVDLIFKEISGRKIDLYYSSNFKTLQSLFERSRPGQLANLEIDAYEATNLYWMINKDFQTAQSFFNALKTSGANLKFINAHKTLGLKGTISHETMPLLYSFLQHCNGPVGKKYTELNEKPKIKARTKQAGKVADLIQQGIKKASGRNRDALNKATLKMMLFLGTNSIPNTSDTIKNLLNQSFTNENHDSFVDKLKEINKALFTVLDMNLDELNRPFNTLSRVSLKGQGLLADQIPAIIHCEKIEGRKKGLAKYLEPVKFDGLNDRFVKYSESASKTNLTTIDSRESEELMNNHRQYIELCILLALIENKQVIQEETRETLLASGFKDRVVELAQKVTDLGYDLPHSYNKIVA